MNAAEPFVLRDLGIILLSGTAVLLVARSLRLPSIVAYLLAGLALGPGLGIIPASDAIEIIAEAGIVLLLFLVGLELSVEKITKVGRVSLSAGLLHMTVTGLTIAGISWLFGLPPVLILFFAVAITFSSTVVVVKLLDQLGALDARHGRIAVGVLLVEDVAVLVVLTIVAGLGRTGGIDAADIAIELARAFGGMLLLLGAAIGAAVLVLPRIFARAAISPETVLIWSLAWCFSMVFGSEALGLSPELGAFIAGVSLADLPHSHDLRRRVHPLMDFFIAVFFVSLGVHLELGAALAAWPLVVALSVFTLVMKPVVVAWVVRTFGETPDTAIRAGIVLAQTSEFSFVLAALVVGLGLVGEESLSVVAAVGVITMGLSAFTILHQERLIAWFARMGAFPLLCGAARTEDGLAATAHEHRLEGHVIVIGMNSLGRAIVESLVRNGETPLAIDTDLRKLQGLPCATVLGSAEYLSVLHEANIAGAKLLVSALRIEDVNRLVAYRAATFGVPAVIHVYDQVSESEFSSIGVAHVLDSRAAGIRKITEALREEGVFTA